MTRAQIEAALREARRAGPATKRPAWLDERMRRSAEAVAAIRAEWERLATTGDTRAKRLLSECYPEETAAARDAAAVLVAARSAPPKPYQDREPGCDDGD